MFSATSGRSAGIRRAETAVQKFDDLPAAYRDNINAEPPFAAGPGGNARLNADEIADVVALLKTLPTAIVPPTLLPRSLIVPVCRTERERRRGAAAPRE